MAVATKAYAGKCGPHPSRQVRREELYDPGFGKHSSSTGFGASHPPKISHKSPKLKHSIALSPKTKTAPPPVQPVSSDSPHSPVEQGQQLLVTLSPTFPSLDAACANCENGARKLPKSAARLSRGWRLWLLLPSAQDGRTLHWAGLRLECVAWQPMLHLYVQLLSEHIASCIFRRGQFDQLLPTQPTSSPRLRNNLVRLW